MKFPKDKKIILTKHCIERFRNFGYERVPAMIEVIHGGEEEEIGRELKEYKAEKYNDGEDVTHYRNGTFIYTAVETICKYTNKPIYLIITIYDQEQDVR